MLKWIIHRKLRAFEKAYGYDASYMHEVLDLDVGAFLKFGRATGLGRYRKNEPAEAYFAATLAASMHADCGPCTQLGVTFALQSGVPPRTIAAVINGDETAMTPDAQLGYRFARAVLAHAPEADPLREEIVKRWGPRAVLALAFGMMAAQMYPMLKYALGHGQACTRVVVSGQAITPMRAAIQPA
jgi:hypothetical protein